MSRGENADIHSAERATFFPAILFPRRKINGTLAVPNRADNNRIINSLSPSWIQYICKKWNNGGWWFSSVPLHNAFSPALVTDRPKASSSHRLLWPNNKIRRDKAERTTIMRMNAGLTWTLRSWMRNLVIFLFYPPGWWDLRIIWKTGTISFHMT